MVVSFLFAQSASCYTLLVKSALKALIILALGGMTLSAISFVIWINVNRDISGLAFGRIVSVSATTIEIADRNNVYTTILIGTGTTITNQGSPQNSHMITVGQFVQIQGLRLNKHLISADTIRLMDSPRQRLPK